MLKDITFQQIENSVVIISKGGVESQHEAYLRRGHVYAKVGSGYIGLRRQGTSKPGITLKDYDLGGDHEFGFTALGRLVLREHPESESDASSTRLDAVLPDPGPEPVRAKRKK